MNNKRTLKQNSLLWKLICEIAIAKHGNSNNAELIYCDLLSRSGSKCEVIYISHDALLSLIENQVLRNVKIIKQEVVRHQVIDTALIFYGSSRMDKKEMSKLIDTTLDYAKKQNINIEDWRNKLNG